MSRLTLRRETLAELSADELSAVAGARPDSISICLVPLRTLKPEECITELRAAE